MGIAPKITAGSMTITSTLYQPSITYTTNTNGSGVYTRSNVRIPETYTLTPDPGSDAQGSFLPVPAFICQSSTVAFTTQGETATRDFGFWKAYNSWFQVLGGNVLAESTSAPAIQSRIPTTCTVPNGCTPFVLRKSAAGTAGSSGFAVAGEASGGSTTGQVVTAYSGGDLSKLSEENNNVVGVAKRGGFREDYDYFFNRLYSMGTTPQSDFSSNERANLQKPDPATLTPVNPGRLAYYAGGDVTIDTAWAVSANESIVIFVGGNLTIKQQITVANGGFLAFVASGNITIDQSLGTSTYTSETPLVEGVYIADGTFTVATNGAGTSDTKFIGAGTFVGWSGINLRRDYKDNVNQALGLNNNTKPTELFVARPDFAVNSPATMRKPLYSWQEVAP